MRAPRDGGRELGVVRPHDRLQLALGDLVLPDQEWAKRHLVDRSLVVIGLRVVVLYQSRSQIDRAPSCRIMLLRAAGEMQEEW